MDKYEASNINGTLYIRDKSPGSLSCNAVVEIEDNTVVSVKFSGYPRSCGDSWVYSIKNLKVNNTVVYNKFINNMLSYDGKNNVAASFDGTID